jgi:hypothetical protein
VTLRNLSTDSLKEVCIGGMAITIATLVFMLLVTAFMLDSGQPAKMIPVFQQAYGQNEEDTFMSV